MTLASACGKIILLGEHAVVYGRPALAVPLPQLRAEAEVITLAEGEASAVRLEAPDVYLSSWLHTLKSDHPLAKIVQLVRQELAIEDHPAVELRLRSSIPVASGLGSGTAVSVAITRALSKHWGKLLPVERQSALAYEVEKLHHGTPSGIDNTVVAHEQPVYFMRGEDPQPFPIASPLTLVLGDSGQRSPTSVAVGLVRAGWLADANRYEGLFNRIAAVVDQGKKAIEQGDLAELGSMMDKNQTLLRNLGVSSAELEALIEAARRTGALGAKLSGAGMGGNMIALVEGKQAEATEEALCAAGAPWTMTAEVRA